MMNFEKVSGFEPDLQMTPSPKRGDVGMGLNHQQNDHPKSAPVFVDDSFASMIGLKGN
jgi:hypothetical protein